MNAARQKTVLILPWVGKLPWYYGLFESSVRHAGIDLCLIHESAAYFRERAEKALGVPVGLEEGYKLCDLKPMYGKIFAEEVSGYDYWAFGDCDVVYGRKMGAWIDKVTSEGWDVACVRRDWTSGAFTLMRNCEKVNSLFERSVRWKEAVANPRHVAFDELGPYWLAQYLFGGKTLAQLRSESGYFADVMWKAEDMRFLREDIMCEDGLAHAVVRMDGEGALTWDGQEVPAYHMVASKTRLGFRGAPDGSAVYTLSRYGYHAGEDPVPGPLKLCRVLIGGSVFAWHCLCGRAAERQRLHRVIRRRVFRSPRWWEPPQSHVYDAKR